MKFEVYARIEREVVETFKSEIEADSKDEAQDLLFEILTEYPTSNLSVTRLLRIAEEAHKPHNVELLSASTPEEREYVNDDDYYDGA